MSQFYPLTVIETREEIGGQAKSVMFDVPAELQATFRWRAGQHLPFKFDINGEDVRRSYSISSSPVTGEPLRITVKRVKGGLISNHINDNVKAGDTILAMPPNGSFCLDAVQNQRRTHYFFGAGSGITPLYSMLTSVLTNEPHSSAHLIYGNNNAKSIIFADELAEWVAQSQGQLSVSHVLSNPSLWSGFDYWRKGIVDKAAIEALIGEHPPYAQDAQYYICGPGGMNQAVKAALMAIDVPANRIHMESYGDAAQADDSVKGIAAQAKITLEGKTHQLAIGDNQTVLAAAQQAGLEPPYSCQSGVCGSCKATLKSGEVHMRAHMALDDEEIAKGSILCCQAVALSPQLQIVYD